MKQGWEIKQLGDISETIMGQAPSSKDCNKDGQGYPFVKTGQFRKTYPEINEWTTNPLKKVEESDVLITVVGATIGKLNLGINCAIGRSVAGIRPDKEKLNYLYLYNYLSLWIEKLRIISQGAAITVVTKKMIYDIPIPTPSLDEQKRIVVKLDECFEAINKARTNVEKNLRKTEELHQSLLFQILCQDSEKWEKSILGESCEFFNGKAHEKAIHTDGNYVVVNSKFISRDGKIKKYTREQMFPLFKNDIVMVMSDVPNGKALAKCYLIEKDNTYSLNQRICAIRSENYIHKYLFYQLNRHRHLLSFNNGENQTNLRKNDILNTPLYIPPFDDQEEVVKKLDEVVSQTQSLESNYQQELDALDELKKTILQKAFNGEL